MHGNLWNHTRRGSFPKLQCGLGEQKAISQTHQLQFEQIWMMTFKQPLIMQSACRHLCMERYQDM